MPVHQFAIRLPSADDIRPVAASPTGPPRVRRSRTLIALPWVRGNATAGSTRVDERRAA